MSQRAIPIFFLAVCAAWCAEKSIKQTDLPAAVRDALSANTAGAEIKNIVKETAKGKTVYEVETIKDGLTRDVIFSASGAVLETEQQVSLDSIPAASRSALEAKAKGAKIEKVEALTKNGKVSYEAVVLRNGRNTEITAP